MRDGEGVGNQVGLNVGESVGPVVDVPVVAEKDLMLVLVLDLVIEQV